jgi:hypothetical protein
MKKAIIILLISMMTSVFYAQNTDEINRANISNDLVRTMIPSLIGKDYFIYEGGSEITHVVSKTDNVYTYYRIQIDGTGLGTDVIKDTKTLKPHPILEKIFTNFVPKAGIKRYSSEYTQIPYSPFSTYFAIYKNGVKSFDTYLVSGSTIESPIPDEIHVFLFADLSGYNAEKL